MNTANTTFETTLPQPDPPSRPVGGMRPLAILLAASMPIVGLGLPGASAAAPNRPNILYICTDDLDSESIVHMPKIQSLLVGQGVCFTNSFVTTPVCAPSVVSMLTGKYAHNHQIKFVVPPLGGWQKFHDLDGEDSTIATWLQSAGYRTGRVGKYVVGYPVGSTYVPPGWDDWRSTYDGFNSFFNYTLNENGVVVPYGAQESEYVTDVLAEKALAFIDSTEANDDQPFFLVLSVTAPHSGVAPNGPPQPAPRHVGAFAHLSAPRPPSFNEADVTDKPASIQALPLLNPAQIAAIDAEYRNRLESMLSVDEAIEDIVSRLAELGELENTYIVFTSDNGYHLGQHRFRNGKNEVYEEDIRVPLIVRGPGVPAGTTLEHFALNIDLAPTFAELGMATPTDFMDGRSLVPLLGNTPLQAHEWRDDFLVEVWRPANQGGDEIRALRTRGALQSGPTPASAGTFVPAIYAEYLSGSRELYNLVSDPYELTSVHQSLQPGQARRWSERLWELVTCSGGTCH